MNGALDKPASQEPIRLSSYGPSGVSITGCTRDESDDLVSAFAVGSKWVRVSDGRLESQYAKHPLVAPYDDDDLLPFWRTQQQQEDSRRTLKSLHTLAGEQESLENRSPHITIQHLCGYEYTHERYKSCARTLERFGFECLRSRRGHDGHFWEIWYLPGLWAAKGTLAEAIGKGKVSEQIERAVRHLLDTVSFGTLDVAVQRACMVIE